MNELKRGVVSSLTLLFFLLFSGFKSEQGKLQYYKGTIGSDISIQMNLELTGSQASGSFIYDESGDLLVLKGVISATSQSVKLNVFNDKDVNIAKIEAHYYTDDLDQIVAIKGRFIDFELNRSTSLNLEKVAEYLAVAESGRLHYY